MFRMVKLLLSVSVVCGVLSLAMFYIYTVRYTNRNVLSFLNMRNSKTLKTEAPSSVITTREITEKMPTQDNLPTSPPTSLSSVLSTPNTSNSKQEGGDSVDKLIETSLEKSKKGGHGDGDQEPSDKSPDGDDSEEQATLTGSPPKTDTADGQENTPASKSGDEDDENLELCPAKPPTLTGPLYVNQNIPKMEDLEKHFSEEYGGWVQKGGAWKPTHCKPRVKMALIIPFRKRYEQLAIFVRHMHPMLKRQEIDYRIIVVEQSGSTPFNRAILFNIGYKEALKFKNFNCFIFHDVDLIPEDDRNLYTCPTSPRHMSVAVDKFNYHLPYASIFGGAGSFLKKDFEEINGFSNKFWGWGGEDDDLYQRVVSKGHHLSRPSAQIGRYKMIRIHHHQSSKADPNRHNLLQDTASRMVSDGLNSLKYQLNKVEERSLYTLVTVHVDRSMIP